MREGEGVVGGVLREAGMGFFGGGWWVVMRWGLGIDVRVGRSD